MHASDLSDACSVRPLLTADAARVLPLLRGNVLFYRYHPPAPTLESIGADMTALPPGRIPQDKHYVGFFRQDELLAVLDLVLRYPSPEAAMIGFFMVDVRWQGQGIGSRLIADVLSALAAQGFARVRLAVDEGNPQSRAFWLKNGFAMTGERIPNAFSAYLPMEKSLI